MVAFVNDRSSIVDPDDIVKEACWLAFLTSMCVMEAENKIHITKQQLVDKIIITKTPRGTSYILAMPFDIPVFLSLNVESDGRICYPNDENPEDENALDVLFNAMRLWKSKIKSVDDLLNASLMTCIMMQGCHEIDFTVLIREQKQNRPVFETGHFAFNSQLISECQEHKIPIYQLYHKHYTFEKGDLSEAEFAMKKHAIEYGGEVVTKFHIDDTEDTIVVKTTEDRQMTIFDLELIAT